MSKLASPLRLVGGALLFCSNAFAQDGNHHGPLIQLRLAREAPAPGFVYMKGLTPNADAYVGEPIVSDTDIRDAMAQRKPSGLVVSVHLTRDAASRLNAVTKQNIGGRVAVIVNGRLVEASPIVDSLRIGPGDDLHIGLDVPEGTARRIAAAVAERWKH